MELVDIHSFVNMDMDSESRVIAPTSAREIRNLRLNEFGKSGVPVGMRGTKKIHGLQIDPDITPVVETTGSITITLVIVGDPTNTEHFRVIITGRSPERPVFSAYINQFAPAVFADIPLDIYDVEQEMHPEYAEQSIAPNPVDINVGNRYAIAVVINEVPLELTFDDIINAPVVDPSSVDDWNTFFDLPTYGNPFTSVEVVGNVVKLYGGSGIHLKDSLFSYSNVLVSFYDIGGFITTLGNSVFRGNEIMLKNVNIPNATIIGTYCFLSCQLLETTYLPKVISIPDATWDENGYTKIVDLSSCIYLGSTTGTSLVFSCNSQTITLTIPSALMTCNGGAPDGDIAYLITNNNMIILDPLGNILYHY